ncbi:peroxiredoxin-like family protein [Hymenobacter nivis]|uniref:thioredoxin-dependent peroxiredoxin n=1 Tax=Hymenobacter nivis TaxID=1850093 RepID=A0A2Z3GLS6_9BACT|nr:peroxiredoxin-like family protein [Hymenobacter nivis]AWM33042.1 alkyl hydroperoxide reductase [Hymenobacter nivis]
MSNRLLIPLAALALALPVASYAQQTPPRMATPLVVGSVAPAFKGLDAAGRPVALQQLLKKGPVVLYFYRGQWCPFCNKQLSQLQDSLQLLTAKGAQVVVVTPETQENIGKTVAKTKAAFPIVHDQDFAIMTAYHTAFTVDPATVLKYKAFGVDLQKANASPDDVLPVPATYVIGRDGRIKFTYFNPDYRQRVSVRRVAAAL